MLPSSLNRPFPHGQVVRTPGGRHRHPSGERGLHWYSRDVRFPGFFSRSPTRYVAAVIDGYHRAYLATGLRYAFVGALQGAQTNRTKTTLNSDPTSKRETDGARFVGGRLFPSAARAKVQYMIHFLAGDHHGREWCD